MASTQFGRKEFHNIPCQICFRKGHGALNCYNCLNVTKFPPTHGLKTLISAVSEVKSLANMVSDDVQSGNNMSIKVGRFFVRRIGNPRIPRRSWAPNPLVRGPDFRHHDF